MNHNHHYRSPKFWKDHPEEQNLNDCHCHGTLPSPAEVDKEIENYFEEEVFTVNMRTFHSIRGKEYNGLTAKQRETVQKMTMFFLQDLFDHYIDKGADESFDKIFAQGMAHLAMKQLTKEPETKNKLMKQREKRFDEYTCAVRVLDEIANREIQEKDLNSGSAC